jgi:hypothetical protein
MDINEAFGLTGFIFIVLALITTAVADIRGSIFFGVLAGIAASVAITSLVLAIWVGVQL